MATIGKKQRLTETMREDLIQALEQSVSLAGACDLVCISRERLEVLMRAGRAGERLTREINRAQAVAEHALCVKVMASPSAKDALAMLTARFSRWDRKAGNSSQGDGKAEELLARLASVPEVERKRN